MTEMILLAGVDYSITSPAITVYEGLKDRPFSHRYCTSYYFDDRKSAPIRPIAPIGLKPSMYPLWMIPEERYDALASWAVSILATRGVEQFYLEDYVYNQSKSKPGLVFNMAENVGILKNYMWLLGIKYIPVSPTELKLWVAGNGQAKKEDFEKRFVNETEIENFRFILGLTEKAGSPISDIIDSFYLAKWGFFDKTCGVEVPEPKSGKRKKGPTKRAKTAGLKDLKPLSTLTPMKKEKPNE